MTPNFIIRFKEEFIKYMPPGKLTFETEDSRIFKLTWDDAYIKYDFTITVPIDPMGHNRMTAFAQMKADKIIKRHYL